MPRRVASEEKPMSIQWRDLTGRLTRRYSLAGNQDESKCAFSDEPNGTSQLQDRVALEVMQYEEHQTRTRHAAAKILRFQRGMTGAGITLSQPSKPSDPRYGADSVSLSQRRDTQEER